MNILLTGASGFIGKSFKIKYSSKYNIISIVRKSSENNPNEIVVNLAEHDDVSKVLIPQLNKIKIDAIVHGASRLTTNDTRNDISVLHENLNITENIIKVSKATSPASFIHLSSIAVYPNDDGSFSETSHVNPSTNTEGIYGLSKLIAENLIDFYHKNTPTTTTHLRLAQVYGEGMRKDRIHSIMTEELSIKNCITVYGEGERTSNFISVKKLLPLIDFFIETKEAGIYNIGNEHLSYLELAKEIIRSHGNTNSVINKAEKGSRSKFVLTLKKLHDCLSKHKKYDLINDVFSSNSGKL